jgi:hypothetical protein
VRGLIEPKRTPVRFVLTEQGRKVLAALLRDEPEI